jgi:3'5'-cyclic nucleotide phosphodiesterase
VNGEGLSILLDYTFDQNGLYEALGIDEQKLKNFSKKIAAGYLNNPYHNKTHALDVCQTTYFFLNKCHFREQAELSSLEIAAMLLAAAVHDYEHPGLTNIFLILSRHEIALRYNGNCFLLLILNIFVDKSVLENHHISSSWLLMLQDEKCDIFCNLKGDDYKLIRQRMIAMVLSTDMSSHFGDLAKTKARVSSQGYRQGLKKNKKLLLF